MHHFAAEGKGYDLYAATNAEEGEAAVVGHAHKGEFKGVALAVDIAQPGQGVFARKEGVDVGSARQQQGIEAVEQAEQVGIGVATWRNDHYIGSGGFERTNVAGQELQAVVGIIAADAYERTAV